MLPALENVPKDPVAWARFSFDHRDSHDRIRLAIAKKYHVDLADYQIDPIDLTSPGLFLQNNSQLHGDMNGILRLQSADLQDVDFTDEQQFIAWIRLHYQEHEYAELALAGSI